MKKAFLTGITGMDASHLSELLLDKGYEVHGLIRRTSTSNTHRIDHLLDKITLHSGDLTDGAGVYNIITNVEPDEIYHLGAMSHVKISFEKPAYTAQSICLGTTNVLESARHVNKYKQCKVYNASSSEMFGDVLEVPQTELTPFNPQSPYACAKTFAHQLCNNYRRAYNMFICSGILFNHEGPRRGENFVTKKITQAAVRIKLRLQDKLILGNLDAKRDWGYSGDFVEAMYLMLQQDKPDDYVVATGETHTVREFLEETFNYLELDIDKYVEISPAFYRPSEVNFLLGDASKARDVLGWEPKVKFKELVKMMIDYDMSKHIMI